MQTHSGTWKRRLLGWLGNLLLLGFTLVVLAIAGEIFIRLSGLQPWERVPAIHQESPIPGLVFELKKDMKNTEGFGHETVSTNSLGFRSAEVDPKKPTIAMLGDSMTFGFGVADNETNPAELQKLLPGYNVVNTGVASYNIEQEALTYRNKVMSMDPSLVILEFVTNDAEAQSEFTVNGTAPRGADAAKDAEKLKEAVTKKGLINFPGKFFLEQNSSLFRFIERRTKSLPFRSKSSIFGREWTDADIAYYTVWFNQLSQDIGDKPKLFVMWPDGFIYPKMKTTITTLAQSNGWLVLDLSDVLGNGYKTLGWDHHPEAGVHKQAAELMKETIEKYGLLR